MVSDCDWLLGRFRPLTSSSDPMSSARVPIPDACIEAALRAAYRLKVTAWFRKRGRYRQIKKDNRSVPKQNTYAQDADGKAAFVERYVEQQPISEEPGRIIHAVTWQSSLQLDDVAFTEVLHGD